MKYETRNHLGLGALILGGVVACFSILFTTGAVMIVLLVASVSMVVAGGWMMTREFTDADVDHPDYENFQQRKRDFDERTGKNASN